MSTETTAVRDGAGEPWGIADGGPTLTGTIAAAIMGVPWAHAHPGSISDDDAGEMVADRYGQVQEIVEAAVSQFAAPSAAGGGERPGDLVLVPRATLEEAISGLASFTGDATGETQKRLREALAASPSQGSDTGEAGRKPTGPGHSRAEPSGLGPEAGCPSRGEILAALAPFARAARGIPDDLPDDLWTHCKSYPWDMSQQDFDAMRARGVPLLSRETELSLWMDGHPLSDFRRAALVYAALDAAPCDRSPKGRDEGSARESAAPEGQAPSSPTAPQGADLAGLKTPCVPDCSVAEHLDYLEQVIEQRVRHVGVEADALAAIRAIRVALPLTGENQDRLIITAPGSVRDNGADLAGLSVLEALNAFVIAEAERVRTIHAFNDELRRQRERGIFPPQVRPEEEAKDAADKAFWAAQRHLLAMAAQQPTALVPATSAPPFRTGDHILHKLSGETWVCAWADPETGYLSWLGWPPGEAKISDFELAKAATDEEHHAQLRDLKRSTRCDAAKALRLYGDPAASPPTTTQDPDHG